MFIRRHVSARCHRCAHSCRFAGVSLCMNRFWFACTYAHGHLHSNATQPIAYKHKLLSYECNIKSFCRNFFIGVNEVIDTGAIKIVFIFVFIFAKLNTHLSIHRM